MTSHDLTARPAAYTAGDLQAMKVAEIKSLASGLGYGIKAAKKDGIIEEFLAQQGEESGKG